MKSLLPLFSALLSALLLSGCGGGSGGSTPPPPAVTITISPTITSANLNQPVPFTATVSGSSNTSVNWKVNGVANGDSTVGTITGAPSGNVTYTAPAAIPDPPSVTITATSQANTGKSASAACSLSAGGASVNQMKQTAPIVLGTSGGNNLDSSSGFCCGGTLGSLLTRSGTNYILSNNHVLAKSDKGAVNDNIGQPGLIDTVPVCSAGQTVAKLSQWVNLEATQISPGLFSAPADAAIAAVVSGQVDTSGSILQLGTVDSQGLAGSAAPANTTVAPSIGMTVAKSGRTSGLTCSTISSINLTVQVDYSPSCGSNATAFTVQYANQIDIVSNTFSAPGDSGSLIVDAQTSQPVGLLYAGGTNDTVANPVSDVLTALADPNTHVQPTFVGGATHTVPGCTGSSAQISPSDETASVALRPAETSVARAVTVKESHVVSLMSDPAVIGVGVGASDTPGEAAITVLVEKGKTHKPIPATLDGMQTRVREVERFRARVAGCPTSQAETNSQATIQ